MMKKITFMIGTTLLFAVGFITISSCGNSEAPIEEAHEHTEEREHHEGESEGGDNYEHREHSHTSGGHMAHMNDVKNWLKEELGDKYDEPIAPATEEQLVQGKEKFLAICAACHGETGKGDGAASVALVTKPADFTDRTHSKYYSEQGRIYIIKNGIKGTPMIGWSAALNEDEIQAVYVYIRSLMRADEAGDYDYGEGMYTCPMHPEVSGNKDGECPKCGMTLIPKEHEEEDDGHNHEH